MSKQDEEMLNAIMEQPAMQMPAPPTQPESLGTSSNSPSTFQFSQWAEEPNGIFRPSCPSTTRLPAGFYTCGHDERGTHFRNIHVSTDDLIELDDTPSKRVIDGIRKFWSSKEQYDRYGVVYKRGVLLWGPAGSGKTGTLMMLAQELVANGGMVVGVSNPGLAAVALQSLRAIEPERPLIAIFEDIDELINQHGEHQILALLDGEYQISNVVNLASTNYPERLGPRIINRPSRFDERIFIDTPNPKARERYLMHITRHDPVNPITIDCWVHDTAGFAIAHLRELVIAVRCLGQDYEEVLGRLKAMHKRVAPMDEFLGPKGFDSNRADRAVASVFAGSNKR